MKSVSVKATGTFQVASCRFVDISEEMQLRFYVLVSTFPKRIKLACDTGLLSGIEV